MATCLISEDREFEVLGGSSGHRAYHVSHHHRICDATRLQVCETCKHRELQQAASTVSQRPQVSTIITMPAPSPLPNYLYKILPSAPPSPLPTRLPLSDLDRKDGYIHLSTAEQVASTADKWFDSFSELWLLKIKYDTLAAGTDGDGEVKADNKAEIKWEEVGRGIFPHFFNGDLGSGNVEAAVKVAKTGTWADSLRLSW